MFFQLFNKFNNFKQIIDSRSMCTGPCPCALKSCASAPQTRALQPSAKACCLGLPGPPRLHCTACTALHGLRAVSESERILTYRRSPISEREFSELHCTVLQAENSLQRPTNHRLFLGQARIFKLAFNSWRPSLFCSPLKFPITMTHFVEYCLIIMNGMSLFVCFLFELELRNSS